MDDLGAATGVTVGGDDAIDLLLGGEHGWPEDEGDDGVLGILGGVFGMDTNECVATTVVAQLTRDFLSVNWIKMERAKQRRLNPA
jgi:hypothetical protein